MSILRNWSLKEKLATIPWILLVVLLPAVFVHEGPSSGPRTVLSRPETPNPSLPIAGLSPKAPFSPRSLTPIRLAASDYLGTYYADRQDLRFYREVYPEVHCIWGHLCWTDGDHHVTDVYFPDYHLVWS